MSRRALCECGWRSKPHHNNRDAYREAARHVCVVRPRYYVWEVAEEWKFLGRPHVNDLAARLGMTPTAAARALARAKARGLLPADASFGAPERKIWPTSAA